MPDIQEAIDIIHKELSDGNIQSYITYKDLFIFQVFHDDPLEGEFDPFYSVNQKTGEFRDFSVLTDGDPLEIQNLFLEAQKTK